jgi:UDPglucose--hexose-1-phosphate uridylyltransferase
LSDTVGSPKEGAQREMSDSKDVGRPVEPPRVGRNAEASMTGRPAGPLSQLRLDPMTGRWVVVATDRSQRPDAFLTRQLPVQADPNRPCPFCPGNEEDTPPSLEINGPNGEWIVRVVANRYPAFVGEEPLVVSHIGPVFSEAPASGIHEVLVLSPDHTDHWGSLEDNEADAVMDAIRARLLAHGQVESLRYSQVIVNAGREAGASVEHPHGQLLGMSFVPRELVDEQAGFARFAGNCLLCTTVEAETAAQARVVLDTDDVLVVCPYWAGMPFEMLVLPKEHQAQLYRSTSDALHAVGRSLRTVVDLLRRHLGDIPYNVVFHSAPYRARGTFHWHVHIWPKLTTMAGFELGTGVLVNVVAPETAAEELRAKLEIGSAN